MAKYLYPAIFTLESKGNYTVNFIDIQGCYTQGDNLQDAYDMAEDVLCLRLYDMEESNEPIPSPSNPADIVVEKGSFVALVNVDTLEYRKLYDNKAVKKTLTIPSWLNAQAEKAGINFSQVLQTALKDQLNIADN
ncbi:type II toxin-antitoxin system HicB family antitoxin [Desulfosporosinus sp. FKA]|uniref:type II toxin-antitoxin system HicB family antitoxin n=1 Tax=Desulfosporosinus sp. FKA TaxID=1969834 RepID=UPI000B49C1EE|nr:type II toxin-antitoxin system HicB family antitoxin [Desulfosporosinus sp. FKA]